MSMSGEKEHVSYIGLDSNDEVEAYYNRNVYVPHSRNCSQRGSTLDARSEFQISNFRCEMLRKLALQDLGVSTDEMIALALLLGSDYTEGVRGVGIVNAMEVSVRPHGERSCTLNFSSTDDDQFEW